MDNATFHKRQDIKTAIANAGHTLEYLPSYSPDFNHIEPKWAQAKAIRSREGCSIEHLFAAYEVWIISYGIGYIGVASVTRWVKNIHRKPQGFRQRKIDLEVLRQDILDYPDAYQYERAKRLGVAQNAIFLALQKLDITYKKTLKHPKADANRTAHLPGEDRRL